MNRRRITAWLCVAALSCVTTQVYGVEIIESIASDVVSDLSSGELSIPSFGGGDTDSVQVSDSSAAEAGDPVSGTVDAAAGEADSQEASTAESSDASDDLSDSVSDSQDPKQIAESMMGRESRNGFDQGVNPLVLDGITVSIPSYFALGIETGIQNAANYYAEKGRGRAAIWISIESNPYDVSLSPDAIAADILSHYEGAELLSSDPIGLAGNEGRLMTFLYTTENGSYLYRYAFAPDPVNQRFIRIYLGETQSVTYNYIPDFDRIVSSAFISGPSSLGTAGVSPDFLNTMNSLESYFDQYVSLLQQVSNASDNEAYLNAYNQYLVLLEQYDGMLAQLNSINPDILSEADRAYYQVVSDRIRQKLGAM